MMTMIEGWKCGECGVIYAPFIKECRCSVKVSSNIQCLHIGAGPGTTCSKCGMLMLGNITIVNTDQTVCQHTWSDSGQSTGGRYCLNCGAAGPLFPTGTTVQEQGECKL